MRDPAKAVEWFQHAAAKGSAKAQFSLGIRFAEGSGVARDPGRALHWFEKVRERRPFSLVASMASAWCRYAIATRRRVDGVGGATRGQTPTRHRHHETRNNTTTTQAASQNHAKARCNLGIMFASGIGVARDDSARALLPRGGDGRRAARHV